MEKNISITGLVKALRESGFCNEQCSECTSVMETAADVIEDLLQTCAEWTAKYEEARDRCNDAEKRLLMLEIANG